MAVDRAPTENSILDRLNELPQTFYDSEVPDNTVLEMSGGMIKPFGVIYFGGPIRSARDHHIVSSRHDTLIGYCTVQVVSARSQDTRTVANKVLDKLTGWMPVDSGEMILEGGGSYSRGENEDGATRYYRDIAFSYRTNLSW